MLLKLKVHYCFHKIVPPVPTLHQIHSLQPCLIGITFNFFCSMHRFSNWSISFTFSNQNLILILLFSYVYDYPVHLIFVVRNIK